MSKLLNIGITYKTKAGEGSIPNIDVTGLDPEEIQSLMDGVVDEILKEVGLIEVGRNDRKCSYCDGTGIKVINGKDKICISCLGKGEGDAW